MSKCYRHRYPKCCGRFCNVLFPTVIESGCYQKFLRLEDLVSTNARQALMPIFGQCPVIWQIRQRHFPIVVRETDRYAYSISFVSFKFNKRNRINGKAIDFRLLFQQIFCNGGQNIVHSDWFYQNFIATRVQAFLSVFGHGVCSLGYNRKLLVCLPDLRGCFVPVYFG